jgi:hypothetical protein
MNIPAAVTWNPNVRIIGEWWYAHSDGRVRLYEGSRFVGWLDSAEEAHAHVAGEIEREARLSALCRACKSQESDGLDGLCHYCAYAGQKRGRIWA